MAVYYGQTLLISKKMASPEELAIFSANTLVSD